MWLLLSVVYHILPYLREKRLSNDAKAAKRALNAKSRGFMSPAFFVIRFRISSLILFFDTPIESN